MIQVNIHDAKTNLSKLLEAVARGEEVVIAKSGRPVAKLVPLPRLEKSPGRLKGKIRIAEDFDAPLPEPLAAAFRGDTD